VTTVIGRDAVVGRSAAKRPTISFLFCRRSFLAEDLTDCFERVVLVALRRDLLLLRRLPGVDHQAQ